MRRTASAEVAMDERRRKRVAEIVETARQRSRRERDTYVRTACGGDADLRHAVETILASAERTATMQPERPTGATRPERIGRYRVVGTLGAGGMGIVYEAEQDEPRRRVAVKVVRGGAFVDDARIRIFRREAETLARLKHPAIAAIYESGCTDDGHHFFAMELVRGETLDTYLQERARPMDFDELKHRLRLFCKICEAVQYAHQRGVIHRDLKPSNIVVTHEGAPDRRDGAALSEPRLPLVKILDFGLARITDGDLQAATLATEIGTIKGTLPYMAPEQARGRPEEIETRTDVYALGVILYEMLSGQRPHDTSGAALAEALRVICEEPPRPLRASWSGTRRLDADVETIVGKTLAKDPAARYASAAALSEDVERYLSSQPILAVPPSALYQLRKFAARNRALVGGATLLLLSLLLGVVSTTTMFLRARKAETEALESAEQARRSSYVANLRAAELAYDDGDLAEVRSRLEAAPATLRGWEWGLLERLSRPAELELGLGLPFIASATVTFDDHGRFVDVGALSVAGAAAIRRIDLPAARVDEERSLGGASVIPSAGIDLALHPARGVILQWNDGALWLHDRLDVDSRPRKIATGVLSPQSPQAGLAVEKATFASDGSHVAVVLGQGATGARSRRIELFDTSSGRKMQTFPATGGGTVSGLACSSDGQRVGMLVLGSSEGSGSSQWIEVFRTGDRTSLRLEPLEGDGPLVEALAFTADAEQLIAAQLSAVSIWDLGSRKILFRYGYPTPEIVWSIATSRDGRRLVLGMQDGSIRLLDLTPPRTTRRSSGTIPQPRMRQTLHAAGGVIAVAFDPQERGVAALDAAGTLYAWQVDETALGRRFEVPLFTRSDFFLPTRQVHVASANRIVHAFIDGSFAVVDVAGEHLTGHVGGEPVLLDDPGAAVEQGPIPLLALDPTGRIGASWIPGSELRLREVESGRIVASIDLLGSVKPRDSPVDRAPRRLALSAGADTIAALLDDASVLVHERGSGVTELLPAGDTLEQAARASLAAHATLGPRVDWRAGPFRFTPDGRSLVITIGGTVVIRDLEPRTDRALHKVEAVSVENLAIALDGALIVALVVQRLGGAERSVVVWEMDTGELRAVHELRTRKATALVLSPDARRLIVAEKPGSYQSDRGTPTSVHIFDTADLTRLARLELADELTPLGMTADGRRLVLASSTIRPDYPYAVELWGPRPAREGPPA